MNRWPTNPRTWTKIDRNPHRDLKKKLSLREQLEDYSKIEPKKDWCDEKQCNT